LHRRTEDLAESRLTEQQPQNADADEAAGPADRDTDCELANLAFESGLGIRGHGLEHDRAEQAADWVDERPLC
jgi:hypothetical protein